MSELRKQIRDVIAQDYGRGRLGEEWNSRDSVNSILALVAEALLSDAAVEAGTEAFALEWGYTYNDFKSTFGDGFSVGTKAQLAAAGITTTGEEAGT